MLILGAIYFFLIKRDLDLEWIVLGVWGPIEKRGKFFVCARDERALDLVSVQVDLHSKISQSQKSKILRNPPSYLCDRVS